ncbi:hypothetical protein, partial [Alistipes timonensis]
KTGMLRLIIGLIVIGILFSLGHLLHILDNSWYRVLIFCIVLILPSPWGKSHTKSWRQNLRFGKRQNGKHS